jgi:hypothetical protein
LASPYPRIGAAGSPVQLHLWIDNQTDKEAAVMTCTTLDFFWNEGFDVYDAYGHRLLKKNESKRREKEGSPKPVPDLLEPRDKDCLVGLICARNFAIPIPAHTCTNTSAYDLPYDFNRNLAESSDLSPAFITACQPQVSTKIFAERLFPNSIHPRCAPNLKSRWSKTDR